jgi:hypothetical protein
MAGTGEIGPPVVVELKLGVPLLRLGWALDTGAASKISIRPETRFFDSTGQASHAPNGNA